MIFKINFLLLLTICAVLAASEKEPGKAVQPENPYYPSFDYGYPVMQGPPPFYGHPMFNPMANNPYFGPPMGVNYGAPYGGSYRPGMYGNSDSFYGAPQGRGFGHPSGKPFGNPPESVFGPPPGRIPPGKVPPGKVFGPPPGTYFGPYGKFPFWNTPGYAAFHPAAHEEEMY